IKGRNETRVVRDIGQLIVPPAEILAIRGATHLQLLRETTNASWNNAIPFLGPRPQPDYSLGFKREAFTRERRKTLQPFIGKDLDDCSRFAATYDMYFPFLTCEVKCGASALDIADRQNAHSRTVLLQGLFMLYKIVGREKELHGKINGFSISHSDVDVRIWGHLIIIEGNNPHYYREPIAKFDITKTAQADNRWTAWVVVMNILDLWVPDHFKDICSIIDEVSDSFKTLSDADLSQSGVSQPPDEEDHEQVITNNEHVGQPITPETTIQSHSSSPKRNKRQ
ncbi:hypothetical protein EK21DRAFT_82003, partial [Setomelanomma holmii]